MGKFEDFPGISNRESKFYWEKKVIKTRIKNKIVKKSCISDHFFPDYKACFMATLPNDWPYKMQLLVEYYAFWLLLCVLEICGFSKEAYLQ